LGVKCQVSRSLDERTRLPEVSTRLPEVSTRLPEVLTGSRHPVKNYHRLFTYFYTEVCTTERHYTKAYI